MQWRVDEVAFTPASTAPAVLVLNAFDAGGAQLAGSRSSNTVSPIFGPYIEWSNLPCSTWPVPPEGTPAPVHAPGARPILVVGTTNDPATPYAQAVALHRVVPHSSLVTHDSPDHTSYSASAPACVRGPVTRYLLDDLPPAGDLHCPS